MFSPGNALNSLSLLVTPAALNSGALPTVEEILFADAEREDSLLAVITITWSSCCEI